MTDTPTADTTADLKPEEIQVAIAALPAGHVCLLAPRVDAIEKKLADLGAAFEALVPLLTAGKEFADRVSVIEAQVAVLKAAPASPAAHDARLTLIEDAVAALKPIVPALEQHFGIKI